MGTGVGAGMSTGVVEGMGAGMGAGVVAGMGTGMGAGVVEGMGAGVVAGMGTGVGAGVWVQAWVQAVVWISREWVCKDTYRHIGPTFA